MTRRPRHFDPDVTTLEAGLEELQSPPRLIDDVDPRQALTRIEVDIATARAGLDDENEGMVRNAVLQLAAQARELEKLVTSW